MQSSVSSPSTAAAAIANSKISRGYVSYADTVIKTTTSWLTAKRKDDDIGPGLWRIHDELYDLRPFFDIHPGGRTWLTLTSGTDITEAYETHHLHIDRVNGILAQYKVGVATRPRNARFTFEDNGFYRTLRRRAVEHLERLNYREQWNTTDLMVDSLLLLTFCLSVLAVNVPYVFLVAGLALTLLVNGAHGYLHQADNIRMYYFDLAGLSHREWRVSHVLSHHLFTNSLLDMEAVNLEPLMSWMPRAAIKNLVNRYGAWLYGPLVYTAFYAFSVVGRMVNRRIEKQPMLQGVDVIPLLLPAVMYVCNEGEVAMWSVLRVWLAISCTSSFLFGFIGLNSGHLHPDNFHDDGDDIESMDWGAFQMRTIIDRQDIRGNHFMAATQFGDHQMHHLFPTLDHRCLAALYPIYEQTADEFGLLVRSRPWPALIAGQHWQMTRVAEQDRTID